MLNRTENQEGGMMGRNWTKMAKETNGSLHRWMCTMLFLLGFIGMQAQQADSILFQRFDAHFALLDSLIFKSTPSSSDMIGASLPSREGMVCTIDSLIVAKVQAQHRALKSETGLLLSGHTYYRSGDGIGVDPSEDEAIERYTSKVQMELRWNIMNSSFINRKGRLHELSLQGELERVALEQEWLDRAIENQKTYFRAEYDSLLAGVLRLRIDNLQLLNDAQLYLTSDRSIGTEELLKIMDEQAIAERLLSTIAQDYPMAEQLCKPCGVSIMLDTAHLKNCIREHVLALQASELQIALLREKEKNTSYWCSLSLSPFVRYSYYVRPEVTNPSTMDVGVALQIPLSLQEPRKRKALAAERMQKTIERDELMARIMEEVDRIIQEIERTNRGLSGELKRIEVLREYMRLRRENYEGHIGEYNFMSRIKEYNHYLACWENFYSYQYKRDCLIADLQSFLPQQSVSNFYIIVK